MQEIIKIAFVGDINPGGVLTFSGGCSEDVLSYMESFDLRVATLESALGDGSTKCHVKMSDPTLGNIIFSPDDSVCLLEKLNINVVSLANNHVCDLDLKGLDHTIKLLDARGIFHFGAGRDEKDAARPAFVTVKGNRIAFLGYFPPQWEAPYTPGKETGGLNHFYIDKVLSDIRKYRSQCDYLFVMPHWGLEYCRYPYASDLDNAKKMIEAGATGVIGSHTHIVQPIIHYHHGIIATSLGNFIFPDRYVIPPRQTYYPSEEERNDSDMPVTYGFPIVDRLTLKKVKPVARVGVVCSLKLFPHAIRISRQYTRLDSSNWLRLYGENFRVKVKLFLIGLTMRTTLSYNLLMKLRSLLRRGKNKMLAITRLSSILNKINHRYWLRKERQLWVKDFAQFKNTAPHVLTKEQKNEVQNYFKKFGFDISTEWHDYYTSMTGEFSPKYIPADLMYMVIVPYLNYMPFELSYQDKGMYWQHLPNVRQPRCFLQRMNSFFYDGQHKPISMEEAIQLLQDIPEAIIKPTINSCQGNRVKLITTHEGRLADGQTVADLFDNYGKDFIIQERVKQCNFLASLNESSLNSMRILTLRIDNDIIVLSTAIRIGGKGAITDNSYGGGYSCGIKMNGSLKPVGYRLTTGEKVDKLQNGKPLSGLRIPNFDKVIAKAKELHLALPYLRIIGWDFTIDTDNEPVFIEMNTLPGIYIMQLNNGPVFGDHTDDLLKKVAKVSHSFTPKFQRTY